MTPALKFIILLGFVSLFADITYEGARSITGPYLGTLGASAAVVGIVAGLGEFISYGLRLFSGYLSDKTGKYWALTFVGYGINLISVPLLAFASSWQAASVLIVLERFGKAIRNPSRDAMLSYATKETGRGYGFGLHSSLDQFGGVVGPLIISLVLFYNGSYQTGFLILIIPAILALLTLAVARMEYPQPRDLEIGTPALKAEGLSTTYWLGIAATSLVAAGFVDFALIAFHFEKSNHFPSFWIPILYSLAMASQGFASLFLGILYDSKGIIILIGATIISVFFVPLIFLDGLISSLIGMMLWGIGMGAQATIMRAVVAGLVLKEKRGTAYGILNMCFGISWFLGSALMGYLYEISLVYLICFSIAAQLASIPLFFYIKVTSKI